MNITCPHCQFAKDVDDSRVPANPSQVECPKCGKDFYFSRERGVSLAAPRSAAPARPTMAPAEEEETFTMEIEEEESFPPEALPKAGFWIRFAAFFIDGLLVGIVTLAVFWFALGSDFLQMFSALASLQGNAPMDQQAAQQLLQQAIALQGKALIWNLALTVVVYLYFILCTAASGQTIGKRICGIRVIRTNGRRVGLGWAFMREVIGRIVSSIFLIGYLMVAFHSQKRGLHDLIGGTYVIKARTT